MNLKPYFYVYEFLLWFEVYNKVINNLLDSTIQNLHAREDGQEFILC